MDLSVSFKNWVELTSRISGVWEITSNSTANTSLISNQGGVPVGSLVAYEGTLDEFDGTGLGFGSKTGWAICNGSNGTGDARGRNLVGLKSGDSDFNSLSATGGSKTVTLTIDNLPSHNHSISDPGHSHALRGNSGGSGSPSLNDGLGLDGVSGSSTTGITVGSTGGGNSFLILSPFYVVVWIKRLS